MNGIRFYLEYPKGVNPKRHTRKEPGKHRGTVIAIYHKQSWIDGKDIMFEATGGLFDHADSVVCSTSASQSYLRERCKRISETQAREIHPKLFNYLDS